MDTQYTTYDTKPSISTTGEYPFAKPAEKIDDNSKLVKSSELTTNAKYRKYIQTKAPYIREWNIQSKK
jgi:hypothetical protein